MTIIRLRAPNLALLAMRILLAVSLIILSTNLQAGVVPSNILQRVFNLRMGSQTATGFTVEVDGRQYLLTARHLIASSSPSGTIEIFYNNDWRGVQFRVIAVAPNTVDIAVLALDQQLSGTLPITLGFKGAFLSQEVFFVGFPFGLSIDGRSANGGFPLPLVKHGIIASFASGNGEPFLVDGINNPGFSGGPVIIGENPANPKIIGVVSGYRAAQESVFQQGQKTAGS